MFAELESLPGASTEEAKARRKEPTEQVTIELVRHSVAEAVLDPDSERKVSAEEAEHAREEHAEAEETLQPLEKLDADDPPFDDELATLKAEIRHPSMAAPSRSTVTRPSSSVCVDDCAVGLALDLEVEGHLRVPPRRLIGHRVAWCFEEGSHGTPDRLLKGSGACGGVCSRRTTSRQGEISPTTCVAVDAILAPTWVGQRRERSGEFPEGRADPLVS
jgi:hypothetical protein